MAGFLVLGKTHMVQSEAVNALGWISLGPVAWKMETSFQQV